MSQITENISEQCLLAQETTGNWRIVTVLILVVILDISSVFLLGIYGHCCLANKALHPNLKALIFSLTLCFVIRNTLTLIRAARMLIAGIISQQNPCYLLTPRTICGIESLINATPVEVACWTFCIISIERTIATFFYKNYERYKFISFAVICSLIPWAFQAFHVIPSIIRVITGENDAIPYCSSISSKAIDIFVTLGYIVPMAIVDVILSAIILFVNIRAKKYVLLESNNGANYLTAKFQRLENIEATRSITVHCITFLVFYIVNVYIVVFIQNANLTSLPTFALLKEASGLTFPIHGNIHVIIGLALSSKTRQKFINHPLIQIVSCRRNKSYKNSIRYSRRIAPLADQNDYFNAYRKQWT
uniref:G-protein coupled receptors family 1 profile domain-containing protein n=1 Tax=Panagrolaimus davidi TaxID=227884 RepID=A0A914QCB3_9BILA